MKIASLMVFISISNITRRKIIMLRPTFAAQQNARHHTFVKNTESLGDHITHQ